MVTPQPLYWGCVKLFIIYIYIMAQFPVNLEKQAKKLALMEEIENNKKEEEIIEKKKEEARTLSVQFRGTKKTAVIKKSEYDSTIHICI